MGKEDVSRGGDGEIGRWVLQTEIFKGMDKAMFHMIKTMKSVMQTERCVEKSGVTQTSVKEEQRKEGRGLQEGWMDGERREM